MYWYYVYKWRRNAQEEWKDTMDVFKGEFHELILFALKQPETWIVTYTKEISEESFNALDGHVG
jgi:hypothetical protein